jgi:two-component system, NtrC family, sensor kinase
MTQETFRILVIDDYQAIHDDVRKLLDPAGAEDANLRGLEADLFGESAPKRTARYRVDSAFQGEEGLGSVQSALARGKPYAVAVVDARMPPGWDGVETIARIWEHDPELQIILCTAYSDYGWRDLEERLGRSESLLVLKKPFDPIELQQMVSALSRKWSLQRVQREDRDRLQRVNEVYRASEAIFAAPDSRRLPEMIASVAMTAMDADYAAILVTDPDGEPSLLCSHGVAPAQVERHEYEQPALIDGGSIHYPLYTGDRLIGVLRLDRGSSKTRFDRHDLERASVLASQIALALENGRLLRHVASSERMAGIGELAAGVSHEINSPLTFLLTGSDYLSESIGELLRDGMGDPERIDELKGVVADIGEGARRIRDIARDLRTLARRDEGSSSLIDLTEVVRSAMRVAGCQSRYRATLVGELPGPIPISGSAGRLSQVFINLIVNATQAFGDRPASENQIVVSCEQQGERVVASVRDNGPGIAPEHMAKIFEPFFTTKETIGTGLGLSISRDIIRAHHGELRVESIPGRGATFSIVLPAAKAA